MNSAQLTTVFLCLVLIEVTGQGERSYCGQLQQDHTAFMTGSQTAAHLWPWHAAIFHLNNDQKITYQCGGTVISSNTILTAAHCVYKNNMPMEHSQISVSLGRLNLSDDNEISAQRSTVAELILHPNYESSYYSNDIAIIRLSADIEFNKYVQPICLWSAKKTNFSEIDGRVGTVVGWGQTDVRELPNELLQADLPVISPVACLQRHRSFVSNYLSETNFCAGLQNGTNVCLGDSGGSMTFEESGTYYIRGIVSVGPSKINHTASYRTCDSMSYALFTDVARFLSWITSNCEENVHCVWGSGWTCVIFLTKKHSQQPCKITFDKNSNVTRLYFHGDEDDLPDISDAVRKFINLELLAINNFELKIVGRAQLTSFRSITTLEFSANQISHFARDTFDDLIHLTRLALARSNLKELHADTFKELPNLQELRLHSNQLATLPANIFHNNQKLERIYLSDNKLKELHAETFKELPNIHSLYLDRNQLEVLPAGIFYNNHRLEQIDLIDNNLKELHADTFKELLNLHSIGLSGNLLEILPANIFNNNPNLRQIDLSFNYLKELHGDTFKELPNLESLKLNGNQFEILPANIFHNNQKLEDVNLSFNILKELSADIFKGLPNLKTPVRIEDVCSGRCQVLA